LVIFCDLISCLNPHDTFSKRFRPAEDIRARRRPPGQPKIDPFHDVITILEIRTARRRCTRPSRMTYFGSGICSYKRRNAAGHLVRHGPGDDHQVGLSRRRAGTRRPQSGRDRSGWRRSPSSRWRSRPIRTSWATRSTAGPIHRLFQRRRNDVLFKSPVNPSHRSPFFRRSNSHHDRRASTLASSRHIATKAVAPC